jgi:predicted HTH transcriptional regulator
MTSAMEAAGLEKPVFQTEGFFFKVIFNSHPARRESKSTNWIFKKPSGKERGTV